MKPEMDSVYDESWKDPTYWRCRKLLADRKRGLLPGKVLDLGCGAGDFLRFCPGATGIDLHPKAIEVCKTKGLDARLMSGEVLDFPDGAFDGVHCESVLDHCDDPLRVAQEMLRVLRPGGSLYLTINDIGTRGTRFWDDYTHRRPFTRLSISALLRDAGFEIQRVGWVVLPPPYLGWTSRWPGLFMSLSRLWGRVKRRQLEILGGKPVGTR